MKKIIAVVLLLSVLSVAAFCMIGGTVSEEKANVTINENIIYGDKSYANGVTVFTRAHYDEHLFWNTTYTIGATPNISTDYEFHYSPHYEYGERSYQALTLDVDFKYGVDTRTPAEECVGLQKAYRELYDELKPGEQGKKSIYLQDYYTYYPVRIAIDLPGVLWQGNDYDRLGFDEYINERTVWDKFNEFFKIPIPEDLPPIEISVSRHTNDNNAGSGSSGHDRDYYFNVQDVYTDDRVIFSIGNMYDLKDGEDPKYIDTSLIPGGYGLYSFKHKNVRNSSNTQGNNTTFYPYYETGIDADSLSMVFPLEQHQEVIYLTLSNDESKLLMFTKEHETTYLTVIDVATMNQLQKIEITDAKQFTFYEYENCIVLNGWEYISVIEKQEDGLCRLAFTVSRMKEVNDSNYQKGVATTMSFHNEKLVIVDRTGDKTYGSLETCGFTVAIYNSTGLVYYGEYESSLSANANPHDYAFNCLPVKYTVNWTE